MYMWKAISNGHTITFQGISSICERWSPEVNQNIQFWLNFRSFAPFDHPHHGMVHFQKKHPGPSCLRVSIQNHLGSVQNLFWLIKGVILSHPICWGFHSPWYQIIKHHPATMVDGDSIVANLPDCISAQLPAAQSAPFFGGTLPTHAPTRVPWRGKAQHGNFQWFWDHNDVWSEWIWDTSLWWVHYTC